MFKNHYYLYKNSPKVLHELKEFEIMFEKTLQKSSKLAGACWINTKSNGNNSC